MDQSGGLVRAHETFQERRGRVSIVWYKHGQEPIRLYKLSQVFKNCYSKTAVDQ